MKSRVVVVGSLNLDLVALVPRMPDAGETVFGTALEQNAGGKGLNQAVAAARMGSTVTMVGAVGADDAGRFLRSILGQEHIDAHHVADVTTATGTALIEVDDNGANRIVVIPGANAAVSPTQVTESLSTMDDIAVVLAQCEVPGPAMAAAMAIGRRIGATTILNPAPATTLDDTVLANVDIIIPNEHEAHLLTSVATDDEAGAIAAAQALVARGVGHAIVTRGGHGAVWASATDTGTCPAFPVTPVDTVAAGDAFAGGIAAALAEGNDLATALRWGSACGALATTVAGAVPSLPDRAAVDTLLG